jgi:ComF family protein
MEELEESTTDICNVCYNKIKVIDETYCRHCGKLRELEDDLCLDCLTRGHEFEAGRGVFVYDDRVKKALFGLKFYNQTWIARKMGRIMAEYYLEHVGWEIDYVMPVPIHYFKYITRGYNQAGVLASYFVQAYNEQMVQYQGRPVKLLKKGLKRIKWTAPQKDLNPETRYKNLENAFIVNAKIMDDVKNCNVLIIDDIYTTGATMDVCARQLKTAQVGKVFFITAAMGSGL